MRESYLAQTDVHRYAPTSLHGEKKRNRIKGLGSRRSETLSCSVKMSHRHTHLCAHTHAKTKIERHKHTGIRHAYTHVGQAGPNEI